MDVQMLINLSLGAAMMVIGWFARELWDAVKELKADVSKLREDLPKTYVAKDDWREDMRNMRNEIRHLTDICDKIFERLEGKADKP